jgi:hypothetical protein
MSDSIINLRQKRKDKKREEKNKNAAENRLRFGETKNIKTARKKEKIKLERNLEGAKRGPPRLGDD